MGVGFGSDALADASVVGFKIWKFEEKELLKDFSMKVFTWDPLVAAHSEAALMNSSSDSEITGATQPIYCI